VATERMRLPGKGMGWGEFFKALKLEWKKDRVSDVAGSVTFAGVLALFPFLLFLVALGSVLIDPAKAQELIQQLSKVAPGDVTNILGERLKALGEKENTGLLTFSALTAIWAASGGMNALIRALNITYGVEEKRPFWKVRGIALFMTLFSAALGIFAAVAVVAIPAIAERFGGPAATAITWLRLPFAGALMMLLWAMLYYFLPDVEQKFRFITPGSVIGVAVWLLASWGFSVYVNNFGKYEVTYGALGGIIVLLLWMWISAQVLLLGAEINAVIEHKSPDGKRAGAKSMADTGVDDSKHEKAQQKGAVDQPWKDGQPAFARRPTRAVDGRPAEKMTAMSKARLAIFGVGAAISYLSSKRSSGNGARRTLKPVKS
jgi:membrane protein